MSGGVGILSTEGGAESVHVAQGAGECLRVELAGYSQIGWLAKELRLVFYVLHRIHCEHFSCALAIRGGY